MAEPSKAEPSDAELSDAELSDAELSDAERAERRRKLAAIFGDTVPEQTSDDVADPRESGDAGDREAWLKNQVPPHHG